eukprot:1157852-Pelagomonas_calceolata.AAC.2
MEWKVPSVLWLHKNCGLLHKVARNASVSGGKKHEQGIVNDSSTWEFQINSGAWCFCCMRKDGQ